MQKAKKNLNQQAMMVHVKHRSYECAQLQYTTQHRTVLTVFSVIFRQSSQLRSCLLEGWAYQLQLTNTHYIIFRTCTTGTDIIKGLR